MAQSNDERIFDLEVELEEMNGFGLVEKAVTQVYQPIQAPFLKIPARKNAFIDEIDKLLEESLGYVSSIQEETDGRKIPLEEVYRVKDASISRTQMPSVVGMFKAQNLNQEAPTQKSVAVTFESSRSTGAFSTLKPVKQRAQQGGWIEGSVCIQSQKLQSNLRQIDRPTTAFPSQLRTTNPDPSPLLGVKPANKRSIFQAAAANNLESSKGGIQRLDMV